MTVYCVVYDYFDHRDIVEVFFDKADAEALVSEMGRSYHVMESKIRKNNDANN